MSDHVCPVDACQRSVPVFKLMCAAHWRRVPADLQRALYRAWNRGGGAGTEAHREAMHACIHAAEGADSRALGGEAK